MEYKGAKYIGYDPVRLTDGKIIKKNDIINIMSEREAKERNDFEPIYDSVKTEIKESKKNKKFSI